MSGGLDAVIDVGSITDFAADVSSVVTDLGTEYMSALPNLTEFQVPGIDVSSLGGFDIAGSFAGSADWFNTFNPGSILDSIPSVSDFNLNSITSSLPSLSSIKDAASTVTTGIQGIVATAQTGLAAVQKIAPTVNAVSSALGVQNPLNQIIQPVSQAIGLAGTASGIATNALNTASSLTAKTTSLFTTDPNSTNAVDRATGLPINTPREVDANGLTILNAEQTAQLTKNVNPAFINSLVDPAAAAANATNAVDAATGLPINTPRPVTLPAGVTSQYTAAYDPETGTWSIFNNLTSTTFTSGLTEEQALLATDELNQNSDVKPAAITLNATATPTDSPYSLAGVASAASGLGLRLNGSINSVTNSQTNGLITQLKNQQTLRDLRQNKSQSSDWRVRLRLAPNSNYLYNDPTNPGILSPLSAKTGTDGVIFPYTPSIETAYKANYDPYDLTHSNYRGYFYKGSYVDAVNMRCTFTAQDTTEANYLLAVIHFFRSVTKMFYGQDSQRGSPPPMVFLSGLGDYQFNEHPCVVSQFNYTLPPDVDYVRAYSTLDMSTNLLNNRTRTSVAGNPLSYGINRLLNSGLFSGAIPSTFSPGNLQIKEPTYVPTKMEIAITLLPMQSRQQVSTQFSVKGFANGNLLKGGFW